MLVFDTKDEVPGDQDVDAAAGIPATVPGGDGFKHISWRRKSKPAGVKLISRVTAGAIQQELIDCVTEPRTNGEDGPDPCLAEDIGPVTAWGGGPVQTRALGKSGIDDPFVAGFNSGNEIAPLVLITPVNAAEPNFFPVGVPPEWRVVGMVGEVAVGLEAQYAGIRADIKAGPAILSDGLCDRLDRHVGRNRRARQQRGSSD